MDFSDGNDGDPDHGASFDADVRLHWWWWEEYGRCFVVVGESVGVQLESRSVVELGVFGV